MSYPNENEIDPWRPQGITLVVMARKQRKPWEAQL